MEDKGLGEKVKAGEPLMEQAVQALRRYYEAQETQLAEEVEMLRHEAEALFVAVNEFLRQAFGGPAPQYH